MPFHDIPSRGEPESGSGAASCARRSRKTGPVPRRVAALLAPPPRRQLALLAIVAILILTAGASAAEAARDLHTLLEFAQAAR